MPLADNLFRMTERDIVTLGGSPSRLGTVVQVSTAAASIVNATSAVPADEVWQVNGATITILPGAAQFATSVTGDVFDNNTIFHRWTEYGPVQLGVGAAARTGYYQQLEMYLLPGEFMRTLVNFNGGAAANQVILSIFGLRLPRGNLLRA